MTEIRGTKSDAAKRLAKMEAAQAAEAAAKKAKEEADAAKVAEMRQWLELTTQAMIEERKKALGERQPPSPERLKAMAARFFMATSSQDEYERMYIDLLLHIINRLDDDSRETFNQILAGLWKAKHE